MKITAIRTRVMGTPGRNWIFVFIETDGGITGIGEATTEYQEHAVIAAIEQHFAPLLIGRNPTEIERLWQVMYRLFWWRQGVVMTSAISGIEQALWDIAGKAYQQPVYRLLGGPLPGPCAPLRPRRFGTVITGGRSERGCGRGLYRFQVGVRPHWQFV